MIKRHIFDSIINDFFKGKVIIIYGARQVGKTTLINQILKKFGTDSIYVNCDEPYYARELSNKSSAELNMIFEDKKIIFIDEAQRVKNIGLTLKLLVDNFPDKQIVATGSSAFELANKINEPLTGRKFEYHLHPFSVYELRQKKNILELSSSLEQRIIYGMYPEVVEQVGDAKRILTLLSGSYLYKDIFEWQLIKKPEIIVNLLQALALQIGSEVSYHELGNIINVTKETILNYIQLLEKVFVIFRLRPLSRNLRKELTRKQKVYFWDTGVRNAIINNFNPLSIRNDKGGLWENFIISERLKYISNTNTYRNYYFWRTHAQQEIDYVEEYNGAFSIFEFKWNEKKGYKFPKSFIENYPIRSSKVVSPGNYLQFIGLSI
jgi:predicted AAA+ superfamily ATPase